MEKRIELEKRGRPSNQVSIAAIIFFFVSFSFVSCGVPAHIRDFSSLTNLREESEKKKDVVVVYLLIYCNFIWNIFFSCIFTPSFTFFSFVVFRMSEFFFFTQKLACEFHTSSQKREEREKERNRRKKKNSSHKFWAKTLLPRIKQWQCVCMFISYCYD